MPWPRACCVETPDAIGRYRFAHALIRETVDDQLSATRRARLHRRAGETILALHRDELDTWLPQLALHFGRAAPVEGPARAIDFALAAGLRADRQLAWEEAAEHYRGALRARRATSDGRDRTGGELLLALGASEQRAGLEGARESFAQALSIAREPRRRGAAGAGLARVAGPWSTLGREGPRGGGGARARDRRAGRGGLAAARAAARPAVARARLRGSARAPDGAERGGGRDRAPDRRSGDAGERPRRAPLRAVAAGERRGAARGGRRAAPDRGRERRPRVRAGGRGLDRRRPARARRRGRGGRPDRGRRGPRGGRAGRWYLWWTSLFRCTRAQIAGEFDEAERLANETLAIGQREHAENALHYYAMAMFNLRREQGRLGEVEDAVARFIELYPAIPAWRCTQALMHVESGGSSRRARCSTRSPSRASTRSPATPTG